MSRLTGCTQAKARAWKVKCVSEVEARERGCLWGSKAAVTPVPSRTWFLSLFLADCSRIARKLSRAWSRGVMPLRSISSLGGGDSGGGLKRRCNSHRSRSDAPARRRACAAPALRLVVETTRLGVQACRHGRGAGGAAVPRTSLQRGSPQALGTGAKACSPHAANRVEEILHLQWCAAVQAVGARSSRARGLTGRFKSSPTARKTQADAALRMQGRHGQGS